MIWEWIKYAVVKNNVIFILILTIIIGFGYDFIPMPEGKLEHPNPPAKPHSYWWFGWFVTNYLIGFCFEWALILKTKGLAKDVCISYFLFDLVGFLSYLYQGWPEPKERIIIGFCLSCLTFIALRLWRFQKL